MVLQHLQSILDSIPYRARLGILTFNSHLNFFRVLESGETHTIQTVRVTDPDAAFCAISHDELFLCATEQRAHLDALLLHLQTYEANPPASSQHIKDFTQMIVLETILNTFSKTGGKAILISTIPSLVGAAAVPEPVMDEGKKQEGAYTVSNQYLVDMVAKFKEERITLDQYWFSTPGILNTAQVSALSQRTGGRFDYYPLFSQFL